MGGGKTGGPRHAPRPTPDGRPSDPFRLDIRCACIPRTRGKRWALPPPQTSRRISLFGAAGPDSSGLSRPSQPRPRRTFALPIPLPPGGPRPSPGVRGPGGIVPSQARLDFRFFGRVVSDSPMPMPGVAPHRLRLVKPNRGARPLLWPRSLHWRIPSAE